MLSLQLLGLGVSVVESIDPNPSNFVSAGILNTKVALIGCLLRLEPNAEKKVSTAVLFFHVCMLSCNTQLYRLTVRTSNERVSKEICDFLIDQF